MSNPLPPEESLHGHIRQAGVPPGPGKLAIFQRALELRGTPPLYAQENAPEKIGCVKFFDPCGSWTWYATEWDRDHTCFGYVKGQENEWGYFDLRELAACKGAMGIGIEVDEFYAPASVVERECYIPKTPEPDHDLEPGD